MAPKQHTHTCIAFEREELQWSKKRATTTPLKNMNNIYKRKIQIVRRLCGPIRKLNGVFDWKTLSEIHWNRTTLLVSFSSSPVALCCASFSFIRFMDRIHLERRKTAKKLNRKIFVIFSFVVKKIKNAWRTVVMESFWLHLLNSMVYFFIDFRRSTTWLRGQSQPDNQNKWNSAERK